MKHDLRERAEAIADDPDLWRLHSFASDVLERIVQLEEALRQIRDYEWHPGQPATDVREIARAALAEGEE